MESENPIRPGVYISVQIGASGTVSSILANWKVENIK
jgi:hypothetical protein